MFTKPLTELYYLSNILPSIETVPKLANLSSALTKYIFCYLLCPLLSHEKVNNKNHTLPSEHLPVPSKQQKH